MMESIGFKLRQTRLRSGLTLEEVSETTRIPVRILQAIEEDNQIQIGSRFFYNSFARQFAQCLKLDDTALAEAIHAASDQLPKALAPGELGTPIPPQLAPLRPRRAEKLRWLVPVGSLALMLLACSGFYSFWQDARHDMRTSVSNLFSLSNLLRESKPEALRAKLSASSRPPSRDGRARSSETAPPVSGGFRLEVSAVERTWLSVSADGKQVYSGILQTSETKELEGKQVAKVRAGNAGGIEVVFNGKIIGPLGPKGQVRTAVFTRDHYTILQPAATFALSHIILALP